ncbi:MAG: hypothetical protein GY811_05025 [Myxococcales bacterium]|nr:hypothetical protein [Myxococcales bacterium]
MRRSCCMLAVLLCTTFGARASQAQARVDWQRGILVASAAAPADLRAPSTELARVKAERVALKRCREKLRKAAAALPTASGKSVAVALGKPLADLDLGFITLVTDQGSDGSVVVRMGLPIDGLRARVFGPDAPLAEVVASAPVFVDARKTKLVPSVGLVVEAGGTQYRGATLFFTEETVARADARVGKGATLVAAKKIKSGVLTIDQAHAEERFAERPLLVVLYSEAR